MSVITKEEILDSLKFGQVFLSKDEAPEEVISMVPEKWWNLLTLDSTKVNLAGLRDLWGDKVELLPYSFEEMEKILRGLVVYKKEDELPSLLYIYRFKSGRLSYDQGFIPVDVNELTEEQQKYWSILPEYFLKFYKLHNGWYQLFSKSGGPMPVDEWFAIDRKHFDIDEETVAKMPFPPERMLVTYSNGGGQYMGFVLPEGAEEVKPVWWALKYRDQPDTTINFWEELDDVESSFSYEYVPVAEG
jgi:hypothetical protein